MAVVDGPLHSDKASGQVGKTAIFQTYKGRSYAKKYAVPGNTPGHDKMNQTPDQLAVQAQTKSLMQHWKTISAIDQATWDALAIPARISRVNAYLRENYLRIGTGREPTDVWPPIETTPGTSVTGATTPDATGSYAPIDDFNSHPAWQRTAPPNMYIFWDSVGETYTISPELADEPNVAFWKETQTDDPNGTYTGNTLSNGDPTVANA
jgi:hypothetical protein